MTGPFRDIYSAVWIRPNGQVRPLGYDSFLNIDIEFELQQKCYCLIYNEHNAGLVYTLHSGNLLKDASP